MNGDLIVRCERESMQQHTDRSDWSVTIEPINGGIQEARDRYLNLAPESGYQPSITIAKKFGEKDYQPSVIEERYYFTAHNGQVYGTLFNDYRPFNLPNQPKNGEFIPQFCSDHFRIQSEPYGKPLPLQGSRPSRQTVGFKERRRYRNSFNKTLRVRRLGKNTGSHNYSFSPDQDCCR